MPLNLRELSIFEIFVEIKEPETHSINCNFSNMIFGEMKIDQLSFQNCKFNSLAFSGVGLVDSRVIESQLRDILFWRVTFDNFKIQASTLENINYNMIERIEEYLENDRLVQDLIS